MKIAFPKIKKIRLRMTVYFTVIVILVILAINFFAGLIFLNAIKSQTDTIVQLKMHTIVSDIHGKISDIREVSSGIQNDSEIIRLITSQKTIRSLKDYNDLDMAVSTRVNDHDAGSKLITRKVIINNENNILDLYQSGEERLVQDIDFVNFSKDKATEVFSLSRTYPVIRSGYTSSNEHNITYFSKLFDKNNKTIGRLLMWIDANYLFEYTEFYCREVFDSAYFINSEGKLIYNIGPVSYCNDIKKAGLEDSKSDASQIRYINNKRYLVFNKPLSYNTDWRLIGLVSYDKLTKNLNVMSMAIYLIGIACIVTVIIVSFYMSKSITNPVIKVNKAILKLDRGEWPEPINVRSEDELKQLVVGFNKMVENLKISIKKIYEEEENKKRAEVRALEFQLEFLQSQINPHFIYNTLNTFSFLALQNGNEKLRELIQSFNILLRSSISTESNYVTIEKELELTDSYLKIQKCRYGKVFDIIYNAPEEILEYKIPKLILQPLVENSIYHGIVPKESKGTIIVEFIREDDGIRVDVIDDGVGIRQEEIPDIINGKRSRYKRGFNNIGLSNINERLKLYLGDEYSLKIYSKPGIGTVIEFLIPYKY